MQAVVVCMPAAAEHTPVVVLHKLVAAVVVQHRLVAAVVCRPAAAVLNRLAAAPVVVVVVVVVYRIGHMPEHTAGFEFEDAAVDVVHRMPAGKLDDTPVDEER